MVLWGKNWLLKEYAQLFEYLHWKANKIAGDLRCVVSADQNMAA